ncbi:MAG: septation protein A [Betaproteobacteria bacterium]|nr:septation protein A [Betaproteobacteria bacterium]
MKILLDFLPLIVFFGAYKAVDIYFAAGAAIVVAVVQIGWSFFRRTPVKPIQWITLAFIVVFGTLTILLHDEYYIKVKWTIFWGLMGALIFAALALKKNPLKSLLGQDIELPEHVWQKLSISWGIYFWTMAALNQYFATVLSLDAWVNVKIFGGTGAVIVFTIGQAIWLAKYMPDDAEQN